MVRILKCKRCKRAWEYKGKSEWYTTCPKCKTSVKVKTKNETISTNITRNKENVC